MVDKMHVRSQYVFRISKMSDARLKALEIRLIDWLADVRKFYPWPALEQSISKDIESIWQEQKRRRAGRKVA